MCYSKKNFSPLGLLLLLVFPLVVTADADDNSGRPFSESSLSGTLPASIGSGWNASGPVRLIPKESLVSTPDSGVLGELGLLTLRSRKYASRKATINIEVFEFKHSAGAYGLWTLHRGQLPVNQREILSGRYVIRFSTPESQFSDETVRLIDQHQKDTLAETDLPFLPGYLPEQDKIPETEKYYLGPQGIATSAAIRDLSGSIDFTGGTHAASAEYNQGSGRMTILLIEYQTPQFGTDGAARLQQQYDALNPDEKKSRMVRRIGNYVVEAIGVTDPKAAEALLGRIKYMPRVYWEGKDFKAIPLEYRPPDPWLIDESIRTGKFVVAAFYWIGLMGMIAILIGVFSGAGYFYWRRSRIPAIGDEFSDAGGMTKLNLDDALLSGSDPRRRMIGNGE